MFFKCDIQYVKNLKITVLGEKQPKPQNSYSSPHYEQNLHGPLKSLDDYLTNLKEESYSAM